MNWIELPSSDHEQAYSNPFPQMNAWIHLRSTLQLCLSFTLHLSISLHPSSYVVYSVYRAKTLPSHTPYLFSRAISTLIPSLGDRFPSHTPFHIKSIGYWPGWNVLFSKQEMRDVLHQTNLYGTTRSSRQSPEFSLFSYTQIVWIMATEFNN